ncbi:MAG: hypothetical protein JW910_18090 [Anaerolineae bacterium]|nr:hypothetical protein [Anaerolineae bacterium]
MAPRPRRRTTTLWLLIVGLLLIFIVATGAVAAQVQAVLAVLYIFTALVALGVFSPEIVRHYLPQRSRRTATTRTAAQPAEQQKGISRSAQRASERASRQPHYQERYNLLDVGLIASEIGRDGMALKRVGLSLDDQAIQPYILLGVDPLWADERVVVRYEIVDPSGAVLFIHEEEKLLRDGRNTLIASHRLPLDDKTATVPPGVWELRVSVDNGLVALHNFNVAPSLKERQRLFKDQAAQSSGARRERLRDERIDPDEGQVISLEELLRGQNRNGGQHRDER